MANTEWDIQQIRGDIKNIQAQLDRKSETLYGNGQEGLTSRVSGVERELEENRSWKKNWENTTNVDDFKQLRARVDFLYKGYWYAVGAIVIIGGIIIKFGDSLVKLAVHYAMTQ